MIPFADRPELFGQVAMILMSPPDKTVDNTLTVSFIKCGVPIEQKFCNIILRQDLLTRKVIVSIGSACNTTSAKPSHVLKALQMPFPVRAGIIRISMYDGTTWDDVYHLVDALHDCIKKQIH